MTDVASSIRTHYASADLVQRILAALAEAGADVENLTPDALFPADQLHGGGLASTKLQAEIAGVRPGMRVLDAGCGIGGAARFFAHVHGCHVEAFDLVEEYVEAAIELTRLCGLAGRIAFRQASVTDLPYDNGGFDLVWCQNVTMNVEDKPRMFAEAFRVLAPGGRYTFTHAVEGTGEPYYPLPWAREPHYSFPGTEEYVLGALEGAGFRILENRAEGGASGAGPATGAITPSLAMGDDLPDRSRNFQRSVKEGRLKGMMIVAERPA